ncbi:RHS repeat-associated core domain-containing protein [Pseudomonas sp. C32]|uniref:RHS repeat-associated core domain-containing protein n=1 Tax=Pseudomonas sp. C32 TaxID=1529208 RepID=UPI00260EB4AF|nr:RHS repeat-associated core domain-containing protein [Pseudomonas sp. C32]MDN4546321.1 RHS repeat-associated core domain-containing protein [Pseudomonas sp. C32]
MLAGDASGSVLREIEKGDVNQISFTAYGHRSAERAMSTYLGFNGEICEAQSGRYLLGNGYRAFNPVLMRFQSPDDLSPFGKGGVNGYAYCGGNPVGNIDPDGHFWFSSLWRNVTRLFRASKPGSVNIKGSVGSQPITKPTTVETLKDIKLRGQEANRVILDEGTKNKPNVKKTSAALKQRAEQGVRLKKVNSEINAEAKSTADALTEFDFSIGDDFKRGGGRRPMKEVAPRQFENKELTQYVNLIRRDLVL